MFHTKYLTNTILLSLMCCCSISTLAASDQPDQETVQCLLAAIPELAASQEHMGEQLKVVMRRLDEKEALEQRRIDAYQALVEQARINGQLRESQLALQQKYINKVKRYKGTIGGIFLILLVSYALHRFYRFMKGERKPSARQRKVNKIA